MDKTSYQDLPFEICMQLSVITEVRVIEQSISPQESLSSVLKDFSNTNSLLKQYVSEYWGTEVPISPKDISLMALQIVKSPAILELINDKEHFSELLEFVACHWKQIAEENEIEPSIILNSETSFAYSEIIVSALALAFEIECSLEKYPVNHVAYEQPEETMSNVFAAIENSVGSLFENIDVEISRADYLHVVAKFMQQLAPITQSEVAVVSKNLLMERLHQLTSDVPSWQELSKRLIDQNVHWKSWSEVLASVNQWIINRSETMANSIVLNNPTWSQMLSLVIQVYLNTLFDALVDDRAPALTRYYNEGANKVEIINYLTSAIESELTFILDDGGTWCDWTPSCVAKRTTAIAGIIRGLLKEKEHIKSIAFSDESSNLRENTTTEKQNEEQHESKYVPVPEDSLTEEEFIQMQKNRHEDTFFDSDSWSRNL